MNNIQVNDNCVVIGNRVWINGEELPPCPSNGHNTTQINGKVYIDGYEYKKGKWRKLLKLYGIYGFERRTTMTKI